MNPRARPRVRSEEGSSLILMLALLSFLGVMLASVLTVAFASFKTTEVTRGSNTRLYSADAGADYGIELLRDNTSYCPEVSATPQSLPSQSLNGRTVQVTCQTLSGSAVGGGGGAAGTYALVVTGYNYPGGGAPDFSKLFELDGKDKPGADTLTIAGNVFNAGKFRFKNDSPILTIEQNLDQHNTSSNCTNDQAAAASSDNPTVLGTWTCRTSTTFPVPDPNPSVKVPTTIAPARSVVGSCTILYPGKYTSEPTFEKDKRYYLASGVYYFENANSIDFKGEIFGGQPSPSEARQFTTITPCSNDAAANSLRPGSATGYGVELVLGGSSQIAIEDDVKSKVELYSRVPANPALEGTPGVSIHAPRTAGTGYIAWNSGKALDFKGKDMQVVIHGLVYMPTSRFDEQFVVANTQAGNSAIFRGGLVVQWLKLRFKQDASNLTFAGLPAPTPTARTVVVTATAPGTVPGEAPTVIKAVVQLATSPSTPPTVLSWRKV